MSDVMESSIECRHSDRIAISHIDQVGASTEISDMPDVRQRPVYSIQK